MLSIQNNNPGNMRPIGQGRGFQRFDSPGQGLEAMREDLRIKISGNSDAMKSAFGDKYTPTLRNLLSVWAPEAENDTEKYVSFVAQKSGINPDRPLSESDINRFMPFMVEMEGGKDAVAHFGLNKQYADAGTIKSDASTPADTFSVLLPNGTQLDGIPIGTTKEQISAKLQAKGIDIGEKTAIQQKQNVEPQESTERTILEQGLQGATGNFADEIINPLGVTLATLVKSPKSLITGEIDDPDLAEEIVGVRQNTQDRLERQVKQNPKTAIVSNVGGALITLGAGAKTKAGATVANSLRTGNLATRAVKAGVAGAPIAAVYRAGDAKEGERLNAAADVSPLDFAGAVIPVAGATARGIKNAVIPQIDDALKPLAQRARDLGIPLRADQVAPTRVRKTLQKVSQELPLSGADNFEATQRTAFTRAVAKTIGQEADDLGPETIGNFIESANKKFSSTLSGETIKFSQKNLAEVADIVEQSRGKISEGLIGIVKKNVDDFVKNLDEFKVGQTRQISGEKLASLRSQILSDLPSIEGGAKQQVAKIIDKIDDVVSSQLSAEKVATLKQARMEWRNFKTIEPLLEKSTDGTINPTELINRVKATKFIKASRLKTGEDELVDLARIGKQFLAKAGGSDTFPKSVAAGGVGAALYTAATNPLLALKSGGIAAGVLAANRGAQAVNTAQPLIDLALRGAPRLVIPNQAPLATIATGQAALPR